MPSYDATNPDWVQEIKDFLVKPWDYLKSFAYTHSAFLFLVNPQTIFFGYPSYLLSNPEDKLAPLVDHWIAEIDNEFDFILILEDIDTCLAILVLKFCWEVRDVVYLKLNTMAKEDKQLNNEDLKRLHEFNWADYSHWILKIRIKHKN